MSPSRPFRWHRPLPTSRRTFDPRLSCFALFLSPWRRLVGCPRISKAGRLSPYIKSGRTLEAAGRLSPLSRCLLLFGSGSRNCMSPCWLHQALLCRRLDFIFTFGPVHGFRHTVTAIPVPPRTKAQYQAHSFPWENPPNPPRGVWGAAAPQPGGLGGGELPRMRLGRASGDCLVASYHKPVPAAVSWHKPC